MLCSAPSKNLAWPILWTVWTGRDEGSRGDTAAAEGRTGHFPTGPVCDPPGEISFHKCVLSPGGLLCVSAFCFFKEFLLVLTALEYKLSLQISFSPFSYP